MSNSEVTSVVAALGVVDRAPFEVSEALKHLRMSHSVSWRDGVRYCSTHVDGLSKVQPAWPIVFDSVKTMSKAHVSGGPFIYIVVDSRAALSNTNLGAQVWPESRAGHSFSQSLGQAMMQVVADSNGIYDWSLEVKEPSLMDYVNSATKPSQLNNFQTLVFKITPYALRKEVQALCISYLAGDVTQQALNAKLSSSFKLQALKDLMAESKTTELRNAVLSLRNGASMEQIVRDTGFQSFEMMYIVKSASNANAAKVKARKTKA